MLKGSKRLSGSTEIHHQALETGQRLLAGRSVWTEEDASGAFIRQRRCGVWLRCGSNMLNVRYQVGSVLYRKPQFNKIKKWSYDGGDGRYDDSSFALWRHLPAMPRREMREEGRKWFPTAEAVWQSLIMLMFCVVYGRSNWFNWETDEIFLSSVQDRWWQRGIMQVVQWKTPGRKNGSPSICGQEEWARAVTTLRLCLRSSSS